MDTLEKAYVDISNIRRPLVLLRGKPLSREQLIHLVANEEPLFENWSSTGEDMNKSKNCWDSRSYCGTLRNLCFRNGFDWLDGWLFYDGTIYGAYYLPKYPDKDEWFEVFQHLARTYDFLDMTVTVIDSDESYCYGCPVVTEEHYSDKRGSESCVCICRRNKKLREFIVAADKYSIFSRRRTPNDIRTVMDNQYLKSFFSHWSFWYLPKDVQRDSLLTLHIHDGSIDELVGTEAAMKFAEYDSLYGDFRLAVTQDSYLFRCSHKCDEPSYVRFPTQFFRDCLEYRNIPTSVWDEKIAPEYLMKLESTKECVIDRDWLFQMYDSYFKGTALDIDNLKKVGVL